MRGEWAWRVSSLQGSAAVELFVERADSSRMCRAMKLDLTSRTDISTVRSAASTLVNLQAGYAVSTQTKLRLDLLNVFNRKVRNSLCK